jgi:hypothetical protein
MTEPQPSEEDELLPELPALDGEVDEESFEPGDDSDLGLGLDDERDLGLDSEAGLDEPLEGELAAVEEDASWLDDGKEPPPAADEESLEADGENESNLTEGSEPANEADVEDWAEDFVFDEQIGGGDSGEEGFGDDSGLPGFELERLPPLDDGGSAEDEQPLESDPLAAELLAELRTGADDDEALVELLPGLRCARMPSARIELALLARSGRPLAQLSAADDAGIAWDANALLVADAAAQVPERLPYAGSVLALTAARTPGGVVVALATPAGVVWSSDGGRHFSDPAQVADATVSAALAITRRAGGLRLWAASAAGPLWASDDGARSFRCVLPDANALRIVSDDARGLLLLGRGEQGRSRTLRSNDAGQSFERIELPVSEPERVQDLQIAGEALLCCRRAPAPQLLLFAGAGWSPLAHAAAPALLLDEDGETVVYFFVESTSGARLLRQRVGAGGGVGPLPQIVAELPSEAGAALQLCGGRVDAVTSLQIGTERAWYRLRVRGEGSAR